MFSVYEHTISRQTFSRHDSIKMSRFYLICLHVDPLCISSIVMVHLIKTCVLRPIPSLPHCKDISEQLKYNRNDEYHDDSGFVGAVLNRSLEEGAFGDELEHNHCDPSINIEVGKDISQHKHGKEQTIPNSYRVIEMHHLFLLIFELDLKLLLVDLILILIVVIDVDEFPHGKGVTKEVFS